MRVDESWWHAIKRHSALMTFMTFWTMWRDITFYYTTKLLGGLIQKIHQSDRAIAGLIFSKYQTGSVSIRPEMELFKMADAEEIEVCKLSPRNTKQFLSRRRRPPLWAWFGHVKQSGKTRGSCWTWKRRSHYEQQLSFKILSKNINPIWHGEENYLDLAWSALVQRWIRQKNRNYSVNHSCTRNSTNTISLILAIFARWILAAFAVLPSFLTLKVV